MLQNTPFEPYQLFNLNEDPGEAHPLSDKSEMYQKLFNELRNHIIEAGAVPWEKFPVKFKK